MQIELLAVYDSPWPHLVVALLLVGTAPEPAGAMLEVLTPHPPPHLATPLSPSIPACLT